MPGPFGQPKPVVDLGLDLASGYQQDAAAKISQAKVKERQQYTSGYAKKYGVKDVKTQVAGKTDVDLFKMATDLVSKRRGVPAQPQAPKITQPKPKPKAPAKKRRRRADSGQTRRKATAPRRPASRRIARRRSRRTTTQATSSALIRSRTARMTGIGVF